MTRLNPPAFPMPEEMCSDVYYDQYTKISHQCVKELGHAPEVGHGCRWQHEGFGSSSCSRVWKDRSAENS